MDLRFKKITKKTMDYLVYYLIFSFQNLLVGLGHLNLIFFGRLLKEKIVLQKYLDRCFSINLDKFLGGVTQHFTSYEENCR
jgi:hypothetical protein